MNITSIIGSSSPARSVMGAIAPRQILGISTPPIATLTSKQMLFSLATAVAGYYLWPKHRVLGALAGHTIGANMPQIMSGAYGEAAVNIGTEALGIYGALNYQKLPRIAKNPVIGYVAGNAVGVLGFAALQKVKQ